jgi:hypothetical protein
MKRNKKGQYRLTRHFPVIGIGFLMFIFGLVIIQRMYFHVEVGMISPLVQEDPYALQDFKMSYKIQEKDPENPTQKQVMQMIVDEFSDLGVDVTMQALSIAKCESGFRYGAYNDKNSNGSNDGGVFQINSIHKQSDDVRFNARNNIQWAKNKYIKDGSWNAWACKPL